ncbi:uncharacterized protein LOC108033477 isoform X2 [Drosophila biarmipes]|uniref:uncharacterized protein LOC108033477 isoform X2 n=1 Tax=Drosophila biarmipes TaxID=125945 RepID=UPI001CDA663B|nr:uncharacterized protein LOC108033477 isoform X2 [Drosophila biarmipes]
MFDVELKELLESWGAGHLFQYFTEEEITLKRLNFITEDDLTQIFRNSKLGEKIEFRYHLTEWKKKFGFEKLVTSTPSVAADLDAEDFGQAQSSTSSYTSKNVWQSNKVVMDLDLILAEHYTGHYVKRAVSDGNPLNDATRRIIIEAIVTYIIKHKIKPSRSDFEKISCEIEAQFNDDKKIYYNNVGPHAAGRLYDRNKLAGSHEMTYINEEAYEAREWLKVNSEPWSEVSEMWRKCYKMRREEILNAGGQESAICHVLNQWPQYSNFLGYGLVEMDFKSLYPETSSLILKWQSFREKILPILNAKLTDSVHLNYLEQINAQAEGSDQLLALLLHVLLRSLGKRKIRDKNFIKSIKDSQLSFMVQGVTHSDVETEIQLLRTTLYNRGESMHPIIVSVGLDFSCSKLYMLYNNIKYALPSFLSVFDICFKMFYVLQLKYPSDCSEFWMFVQKYFYEINLEDDLVSPSILCLISDLR